MDGLVFPMKGEDCHDDQRGVYITKASSHYL